MPTPKIKSRLNKCTTSQKTDLYANANDQDITSLIGKQKVLCRYLWASTNYEHSTVAPTNYGHQKKTTSPNQLWALKTSGPNQLWAARDYKCLYETPGYELSKIYH